MPSSRSSGPGPAPPRGGPRPRPPPGGRPAAVGGHGPLHHRVGVGCRLQVGGQALGRAQEGLGHRGGDPVEGGHGGVDRVGPGGQVAAAGLGPLVREGVLAVVAGHVQGGDVVQRVGPVQLQLAQLQPQQPLEGGQVGLVLRILLPTDRGTPSGFPEPVAGDRPDPLPAGPSWGSPAPSGDRTRSRRASPRTGGRPRPGRPPPSGDRSSMRPSYSWRPEYSHRPDRQVADGPVAGSWAPSVAGSSRSAPRRLRRARLVGAC